MRDRCCLITYFRFLLTGVLRVNVMRLCEFVAATRDNTATVHRNVNMSVNIYFHHNNMNILLNLYVYSYIQYYMTVHKR